MNGKPDAWSLDEIPQCNPALRTEYYSLYRSLFPIAKGY